MAIKLLVSDAQQRSLAHEINAKLPAEAKVTCFRTEDENQVTRYGIVFEYGCARHTITNSVPFYDADEVVADVRRWITGLQGGRRWGLTP